MKPFIAFSVITNTVLGKSYEKYILECDVSMAKNSLPSASKDPIIEISLDGHVIHSILHLWEKHKILTLSINTNIFNIIDKLL